MADIACNFTQTLSKYTANVIVPYVSQTLSKTESVLNNLVLLILLTDEYFSSGSGDRWRCFFYNIQLWQRDVVGWSASE
jgi:hypothetical protein